MSGYVYGKPHNAPVLFPGGSEFMSYSSHSENIRIKIVKENDHPHFMTNDKLLDVLKVFWDLVDSMRIFHFGTYYLRANFADIGNSIVFGTINLAIM